MTFIDLRGQRVTSESAYLTEEVLARPNLAVATGALVERILFDRVRTAPRGVGVQFSDTKGNKFVARARSEVVLSSALQTIIFYS